MGLKVKDLNSDKPVNSTTKTSPTVKLPMPRPERLKISLKLKKLLMLKSQSRRRWPDGQKRESVTNTDYSRKSRRRCCWRYRWRSTQGYLWSSYQHFGKAFSYY